MEKKLPLFHDYLSGKTNRSLCDVYVADLTQGGVLRIRSEGLPIAWPLQINPDLWPLTSHKLHCVKADCFISLVGHCKASHALIVVQKKLQPFTVMLDTKRKFSCFYSLHVHGISFNSSTLPYISTAYFHLHQHTPAEDQAFSIIQGWKCESCWSWMCLSCNMI